MGESSGTVPGWIVSAIVCLLLSIGLTIMTMMLMGYKTGETVYERMADAKSYMGKNSGIGAPNMQGGPGEKGPKGDTKSANAARPAGRVVTLIEKLDNLTADPGKLQLTADQRAKILPHLEKLAEPDVLEDAFAQEHMSAILEAIKDQRKELEDAGFQWSSESPIPPITPPQNPFKAGDAAKHLKALQERMAKAV
jgi:hypothetical protein